MAVTPTFSAGDTGLTYEPNKYQDIGNAIGKVAEQVIRNIEAFDPLSVFNKTPINNGDTIEQMIIQLVEEQAYDKEGVDALKRTNKPDWAVRYFSNWTESTFESTIDLSTIRKVLINGTGAEDVASRIVANLSQSDKHAKFKHTKELLTWASGSGDAIVNGGSIAAKNGTYDYSKILETIKNTVDGMRFVNADYNKAGIERATRNEDIYILAPYSLLNSMDVNDLASVFNLDKVEIKNKLIKLDTNDNKFYIVDRNAILLGTRLYEMMPPQINSKGRFFNYFLQVDRMYAISPLFDAVYFTALSGIALNAK